MSMSIPDQIKIIERHPNAEQPYNLVKEIFKSVKIIKGKEVWTERSCLVCKNIREPGHKPGIVLTPKQLEEKRKKDRIEEQQKSQELLDKANASPTGNSDDEAKGETDKDPAEDPSKTEDPKDPPPAGVEVKSSTGGKATS